MRRNLVGACFAVAALIVAAGPAAAAVKTLTVHPHQLKDYPTSPAAIFTCGAGNISASKAEFMYPVKLPVGAVVQQLKVWAKSPDGGGSARLIRFKDGADYNPATDDIAIIPNLYNYNNYSTWDLLVDAADGPAPAKVAGGYSHYLYVQVAYESVGTIQVVYKTP